MNAGYINMNGAMFRNVSTFSSLSSIITPFRKQDSLKQATRTRTPICHTASQSWENLTNELKNSSENGQNPLILVSPFLHKRWHWFESEVGHQAQAFGLR